jgi:hypothetical protein
VDQKSKKMQLWMQKAKFRKRSAAEAVPGEALESEDFWDLREPGINSSTPFQPCPEAGGGGSMGYRLFRRPLVSLLCVIVFVCLGLRDCGDCGIVSLWLVEFVCGRVG